MRTVVTKSCVRGLFFPLFCFFDQLRDSINFSYLKERSTMATKKVSADDFRGHDASTAHHKPQYRGIDP